MGLDIAYFKNAKNIEKPDDIDDVAAWSRDNKAMPYYTLDGQEDRMEGLNAGWVTADFVDGFRAGSYSGYGAWRRLLCNVILSINTNELWKNPGLFEGKPFVELINFADNEGCIGPVVSKKLAKDFADNRDEFVAAEGVSPYDVERYDKWATAFRAVAGNGVVLFL